MYIPSYVLRINVVFFKYIAENFSELDIVVNRGLVSGSQAGGGCGCAPTFWGKLQTLKTVCFSNFAPIHLKFGKSIADYISGSAFLSFFKALFFTYYYIITTLTT